MVYAPACPGCLEHYVANFYVARSINLICGAVSSSHPGPANRQVQDPVRGSNISTSLYQTDQPLPKGHLRLLTVEKADNATVSCRLDTYTHHLAPTYEAVSHCWGDDKTSVSIECTDVKLEIRRNLPAFLKASFERKHPLCRLWINAICLNQDDDAEKAVQVPQMHVVYKKALKTIVWLGEVGENTEHAIVHMVRTIDKLGSADPFSAVEDEYG